jgi:hypothetical protein
LNIAIYTFEVKSEELLGFVVSNKWIEVEPDKIKAIKEMTASKTKKEARGFLERLNYIAYFISQSTTTCDPIFRLLRKNNPGIWNEDCQEVFFIKCKKFIDQNKTALETSKSIVHAYTNTGNRLPWDKGYRHPEIDP